MPVKYICTTCSSENVYLDAYAEWDVGAQKWVLAHTFDEAVCALCNFKETSLCEVEVSDDDDLPTS